MALKICLAELPEPSNSCDSKVVQRRRAQAQQCRDEKLLITENLMDLNVFAQNKLRELKDKGAALGCERSAIQSKDGLSWREMEDAVRLRSMRISALSGSIGCLQDIEEMVAVETERAKCIISFINDICSNVAAERARLNASSEAQQAARQIHPPPISAFNAFPLSSSWYPSVNGFTCWKDGPIAQAACGKQ